MKLSAVVLSSFIVGSSAFIDANGNYVLPCQDDRRTIFSINNVHLTESESTTQLESSLPLTVISGDGATVTFQVCQGPNSGGAFWTEFTTDLFDSKCVQTDIATSTTCETYTASCRPDSNIAIVDLWSEGFQTDLGSNAPVSRCCEADATAAKITYELLCECPAVTTTNLRGTTTQATTQATTTVIPTTNPGPPITTTTQATTTVIPTTNPGPPITTTTQATTTQATTSVIPTTHPGPPITTTTQATTTDVPTVQFPF